MALAAGPQPIPQCACLLADHLDAVLAAGEDLLQVQSEPVPDGLDPVDAIFNARAAQRAAIERIRTLEVAILARVLKARERAAELSRADPRFKVTARLFTAGTTTLADAVATCSDSTIHDFQTGEGLTAYVRSRGLIAPDAAGLPETEIITVSETFLLACAIPLGELMDLAAGFLDSMEQHFELFGSMDEEIAAEHASSTDDDAELRKPATPMAAGRLLEAPGKLEAMIGSTLQVMFEPKPDQAGDRRGWAPGSLMAALAQVDDETGPLSVSGQG